MSTDGELQILDAQRTSPLTGGASFSLSNRAYRALWNLTWLLLARWTPRPFAAWRRLLLRAFGAKMGEGSDVRGAAQVWSPRNLIMHEYALVGPGVRCYNMAPLELGRFAVVSQRAHLCGGTHEIDEPSMQLRARPIWIGAHAWVAAEAFVGPGVTLAEGAVLGARAVATKDVDSWSVYAGNPARRIKARRNIGAARESLLKSRVG